MVFPQCHLYPPAMLVDKWRRTCNSRREVGPFAPFGELSDLTPAMRSPRQNVLGPGGAVPPALDTVVWVPSSRWIDGDRAGGRYRDRHHAGTEPVSYTHLRAH